MVHVWQHQQGMWVRTRGFFSWAANYSYKLDKKRLKNYPMEQQAQIIADYWLLHRYGYEFWLSQRGDRVSYVGPVDRKIKSVYERILADFFKQR